MDEAWLREPAAPQAAKPGDEESAMVLVGIVVEDWLMERKVDLVCKVMVTWRYQSRDAVAVPSSRLYRKPNLTVYDTIYIASSGRPLCP